MSSQSGERFPTLAGRVAVVTGGSRGIGKEIAHEFAKRGAKVSIVYTSESSGKAVDQLIADIAALKNGSQAVKVQANLRDIEAPDRIVSETQKAFGTHIDVLVNNAGCELGKPLKDITAEDFSYVFDLNVRACFLMAKAVIPHLRKAGRIINLSSVGGRSGFPTFSAYAASKAAVEGMTRVLAAEIGPDGHTVNAVEPGPVASDMLDTIPKELVEMQKKKTPFENRIGSVEDIAPIVAWLAAEESRPSR